MLQKASPRRALAPLPVNTMTSNISSSNDGIATRKRGIDEVEDSELPSRAIRMRTVPQQPLGNQESQPPMQNGVMYIFLFALLIELIIAIGKPHTSFKLQHSPISAPAERRERC